MKGLIGTSGAEVSRNLTVSSVAVIKFEMKLRGSQIEAAAQVCCGWEAPRRKGDFTRAKPESLEFNFKIRGGDPTFREGFRRRAPRLAGHTQLPAGFLHSTHSHMHNILWYLWRVNHFLRPRTTREGRGGVGGGDPHSNHISYGTLFLFLEVRRRGQPLKHHVYRRTGNFCQKLLTSTDGEVKCTPTPNCIPVPSSLAGAHFPPLPRGLFHSACEY